MLFITRLGDPRHAFLTYFPLTYFLRPLSGVKVMWVAVISEWLNSAFKWSVTILWKVDILKGDLLWLSWLFGFKVVPDGYHRYFLGVKVKTVKLVGGIRFLAVRSGLNAQIIQMIAFTPIMDIWTPGINPLGPPIQPSNYPQKWAKQRLL